MQSLQLEEFRVQDIKAIHQLSRAVMFCVQGIQQRPLEGLVDLVETSRVHGIMSFVLIAKSTENEEQTAKENRLLMEELFSELMQYAQIAAA
ncbi:MAG: hypothetical protein WA005_12825 [Candidatus Binataceae bacterium]